MHMNHTHGSTPSQPPKRGPRALSAPRHARCRTAVLAALRTTPPLPDDETFRATLRPRVDASPRVVKARAELQKASERLQAVRESGAVGITSWHIGSAERDVETRTDELRCTWGAVLHNFAQDHVPDGVPDGARWPWRQGGAPWVWRADLLLALPDWSATAIHSALERLEAEGVLEGSNGHRAKKAAAVRLTSRGVKLDELVATMKAHPDVVDGPVGDALNDDAEGGAL